MDGNWKKETFSQVLPVALSSCSSCCRWWRGGGGLWEKGRNGEKDNSK